MSNDIDEDEKDRADGELAILAQTTKRLREHFDTVQILCTRLIDKEDGGCIRYEFGAGHIMAREAHARFFVKNQERGDETP